MQARWSSVLLMGMLILVNHGIVDAMLNKYAAEICEVKSICLELRHEEGDFMLCIKNTYDGKLVEKDGSIQTRKQDKEMHGYGLANVKECVARNQGHMYIQPRDEFVVSIYF